MKCRLCVGFLLKVRVRVGVRVRARARVRSMCYCCLQKCTVLMQYMDDDDAIMLLDK